MKIKVVKDLDNEMMSIEKDGKSIFYGNYWDFSGPRDIVSLLESVGCDVEVVLEKLEC